MSHPMWVRGLKPSTSLTSKVSAVSHPMWVRGLKPIGRVVYRGYNVAPYVGAWIETKALRFTAPEYLVAPYVGAWIETSIMGNSQSPARSHPMWVRGLKLSDEYGNTKYHRRTLCGCVD